MTLASTRVRGIIFWAIALISLALLGETLTIAADEPLPTKSRKVWMRGGVLLAEQHGRSGWLVPDPVEVETIDDGRVTLVDGQGHARTGWCPEPKDAAAIGLQSVFPALGLFAQTEGPVRLDPDGPIVGRVSPGAFVPIGGLEHDWAAVDLPFVFRGHNGNAKDPGAYDSFDHDFSRFFVSASVLGMKRVTRSSEETDDWIPKHGHVLRMASERTSRVFALTWCMPGKVIESKNHDGKLEQRIRYRFEGIEIEGWADQPLLAGRRTESCARVVDEKFLKFEQRERDPMKTTTLIPAGFEPNRFAPKKNRLPRVLAEASRGQKNLWIPVVRQARLECARYRLGRGKKGSTYLAADRPPDPEILRLEFSIALYPEGLGLLGPSSETRSGGSIVAGCANEYRFVRADSRVLEMIPSQLGVFSYHPDDVEAWYADRRTCMERATYKQASSACE